MLHQYINPVNFVCIMSLAPSAVRNLSLSINGSQLTITWQAPSMPNGPETINYSVSVSGINLVDNQMIAITSSAVNVAETMHTIDTLPYSNYTAEVVAFTSAGSSPSRTATIQTPEAGEDLVHKACRNC